MNKLQSFGNFQNWVRPSPENRALYSPEFDDYLDKVSRTISNQELRELFINTFANTLDTTAYNYMRDGQNHTYIITGDIEAMWLRDSTAQVWPYLHLAKDIAKIDKLLTGLIANQARCILVDPYANAFYDCDKSGIHATDMTQMLPGVHERKWELDSLIYPMALAVAYWKLTQNHQPFNDQWRASISLILKTLRVQQRFHEHGSYFFDRVTSNPIDTLSNDGFGPKYKPTGMVASAFRASDDACTYPFNIPENLFAVNTLRNLRELLANLNIDELISPIDELVTNISSGIEEYGIIHHPILGKIYAFEVDGLGNSLTMDDANVPSLLSLPYLGVSRAEDDIYRATRTYILSEENPYYFAGALGAGIGSPHTGKDAIWPISLIIQAITSTDEEEILRCLRLLIKSSAETGLLHESFSVNNADEYTRPWFSWCNSLFGGLILRIIEDQPELLNLI